MKRRCPIPLYNFECPSGHTHERFFKIADKPDTILCHCGFVARQVMAIGGVEDDHPVWLNDQVREALQDSDRLRAKLDRPIETRGEWERRKRWLGVECRG